MKLILAFITLFNGTYSYSQNYEYEKKVEFLLGKIDSNQPSGVDKKELKSIAYDLQNKGQKSDESTHDYAAALSSISKAIKIFTYLGDTLNVANNLKFRGYLLARFGKFNEAKSEIKQAINLFQFKGKDWGVAVSQFDLSRVYDIENKFDSALYYCRLSLHYWKSKNVSSRVFNNHNMLINLLVKTGQVTEARTLQQEAELPPKDPELHWQDLIDFYFVSARLYKNINEPDQARKYQALYTSKIAGLHSEATTAKSYYDSSP